MLVAGIVPINEVYRALKCMKVCQHKRRDQIAAVNQQFSAFPVGTTDSTLQIGDMVVAV